MLSPIPSLVLFQIAIFTFAMLPFFASIKYCKRNLYLHYTNRYTWCVVLLGLLFCIFASYDGDWYHYYDIIVANYEKPDPYTHIEPVHMWIISTVSFGIYIWWRIIIWGLSFWLLYLSFARLKMNDLLTWSAVICICVLQMSTGRVYLGIALLFYGFCCIINPVKRWKSVIKGLILMGFSIIFHKSMIIYICAGVLALIYYKKWMLIVFICAIPFMIKIFMSLLLKYLMSDNISNAVMWYLKDDQAAQGVGILIYKWSLYSLMFILFIVSSKYIVKKQNLPSNSFRRIWQMLFILIALYIVVFCALTLNGIGSTSISSRITLGMYFPLAVLLSKMLKEKSNLELNIFLMLLFYVISIYRLSYAYYLQSIGTYI